MGKTKKEQTWVFTILLISLCSAFQTFTNDNDRGQNRDRSYYIDYNTPA